MKELRPGRIIISNDLLKLKKLLDGRKCPIRYLILNKGENTAKIRNYLTGLSDSKEFDLGLETRNLRPGFRSKYIELISELNRANDSLPWWSLYFTRKECAYTNFGEKIFNTLLIANLVQRSPSFDNVIVTDDRILASQIGDWAENQNLTHITAQAFGFHIRERIISFTIGRMILTFAKAFHYWSMLRISSRHSIVKSSSYVVVGTLVDERCFPGNSEYRDVYLGELPEFISQSDSPVLIFGGLINDVWKTLKVIRKNNLGIPVVPWHYFGTIIGLLNAARLTLLFYLSSNRLKGIPEIDGISLELVIQDEIRANIRSGHVFGSLWIYYSAMALANHIHISAFIFPYENRSWEKMLLKGITQNNPSVNTVGYHHAAISPAHTNMLLGKNEALVFPLPDKIVMTGEITKTILETSGNYPKHIVTAGCALRRGREVRGIQPRRGNNQIKNVLVALASSGDEYINTLEFLDKAFTDESDYQIGIRPHPEFSLDWALAQLPKLQLKFDRLGGSLESNFDWADVVLYVSSTVGLDAISVGLPVVGIDLGKFTNYDPAPKDSPLKWSVCDPSRLVPTFRIIKDLSDIEYDSLQAEASEFGKRYFYPVTDERLKEFSTLLSLNKPS